MNLPFMDVFDRAHPVRKLLTREHALPLFGYLALLMGLLIVIWFALASLAGDYAEYAAATDLLDQLEGRKPATGLATGAGKSGSPFLEGRTVTIAGAALQHRVDRRRQRSWRQCAVLAGRSARIRGQTGLCAALGES